MSEFRLKLFAKTVNVSFPFEWRHFRFQMLTCIAASVCVLKTLRFISLIMLICYGICVKGCWVIWLLRSRILPTHMFSILTLIPYLSYLGRTQHLTYLLLFSLMIRNFESRYKWITQHNNETYATTASGSNLNKSRLIEWTPQLLWF